MPEENRTSKLKFTPEFLQDLRERWEQSRQERREAARKLEEDGRLPMEPIHDDIYLEAMRTMAREDGVQDYGQDYGQDYSQDDSQDDSQEVWTELPSIPLNWTTHPEALPENRLD